MIRLWDGMPRSELLALMGQRSPRWIRAKEPDRPEMTAGYADSATVVLGSGNDGALYLLDCHTVETGGKVPFRRDFKLYLYVGEG